MRGNRGSQYAINDYKEAGNFPTQGEAYRGCRSQPPAVIRITVARSSNWRATPSRKATTLLELAGVRPPGTHNPPRINATAAGVGIGSPVRGGGPAARPERARAAVGHDT